MTKIKSWFTRKKEKGEEGPRERLNVFTGIFFGILIVMSAMMLGLLLWALLTSFKTAEEFRVNKYGFPQTWAFGNFATVLKKIAVPITMNIGGVPTKANIGMMMQVIYSLLYAGGGGIIMMIVPCIVAYLTCKFPYKFSKFINVFVVVAMIIPIVGSQAAELSLLRALHLYDSIIGNWIQKFHFLGMYYLVFFAAFKGVSKEYSEAASIDGASEFTIMVRIMLPMVKTVMLTVFLIKFIELWNDYQNPMLYLPSYPTVAFGVYYMSVVNRTNDISTTVRLAGSILMAVPVLILFVCFKDKLIGNLSMGGVKE